VRRAVESPLAGITVLVVDDHDDTRELFDLVLARAGARVLSAGDAARALGIVADEAVHVLVCDLAMPRLDGLDLIRRLRARGDGKGALPAIAVSGRALATDVSTALAAGYDAHVAKPVDPSRLVACVRDLARR
jgi:CheY-like chemotaxis protein